MFSFRVSKPAVPLVLFCAAIGCSKASGPVCHPVSGQVTYKGKPVAEATVVLHPLSGSIEGNQKPIAYTAADGTFSLTTLKKGDGAPPGEYAITVELRAPQSVGEEVVRNGPHMLPLKYTKPESSGLKFTVSENENVIPAINLL